MKRTMLILLALLLCAVPMAQMGPGSQGRLGEVATEVLKKAAGKFNQNVSFMVTFTSLDAQHKPLNKQSAEVRYSKGKYRLQLSDQELISDGTAVWHWNKTADEVVINNVTDDDIDLLNPGRLLANYGNAFRAKYIRTDDEGVAIIDLQPKSARPYHKIRLFIDEESGLLHRMEVHKYDSSCEVYDISNFKRAANAAAQFTFNSADHPGVEIIDMR